MQQRKRLVQSLLILLGLWALLFLGHSWESGLKLDGMTNSIISKRILTTGDWKIFHYDSENYPDYYPHPPLAIWVQALFFKAFGVSDTTARLSYAFWGLGTVALTMLWASAFGGLFPAFVSGAVLLTTLTYLKFAADAFLEGPLCFWFCLGALAFLQGIAHRDRTGKILCGFLFGLAVGFAFLTKTVFAMALPLAAVLTYPFLEKKKREGAFTFVLFALVAALVVVGIWFSLGNGLSFLRHHWGDIADRVGTQFWYKRFEPTLTIFTSYWPWLPVFIAGFLKIIRQEGELPPAGMFAINLFFSVWLGLTLSGNLFEHYLLPLFPPGAVVASYWIVGKWEKQQEKIYSFVGYGTVALAILLAILPLKLRIARSEPLGSFLKEAESKCTGHTQYIISNGAAEKWMGLAIVMWETDRDAVFRTETPTNPVPGQLLLTHPEERVSENWKEVSMEHKKFKLFEPVASPLCHSAKSPN